MSTMLTVRRLSKTFPGQLALDHVDLDLAAARTHALVGQNGSGKSTLIKILAGYHEPDPGSEARFGEVGLQLGDARAAEEAGIRFVHQDLGLVDALNTVENMAMGVGYTTRALWRVDWQSDRRRAEEALHGLGFTDIDVTAPVATLLPAQKTAVAIGRALLGWEDGARLLVLDEPTAALPGADVERLFAAIERVKERGVAILYVSHHLDEVFDIADEVSVLRDGAKVATVPIADVDHDGLIELMIGHRLERRRQRPRTVTGAGGGLVVSGLGAGSMTGVDLHVEPGEVVGVAGITGSGRELIVPLITGQVPSERGTVRVGDTYLPNYSPRACLKAGMAFVPADRSIQGVVPLQSVRTNLTLSDLRRHWRGGRLRHRDETAEAHGLIDRLGIKTQGTEVPISVLSGGNQQKVLFGRSLRLRPDVLVLDEPTQGIDVGAKEEIMGLIDDAAAGGTAVLVASTDTDELVRLSHRVVVLRGGVVAEQLEGSEMTLENIERAQLASQAVTA